MKTRANHLFAAFAAGAALLLSSCGTGTYLAQTNAYSDDLYATHDRAALAKAEKAQADREAAYQAEREKKIKAMVASAKADNDIDEILGDETVAENPYESVLADDYESAYQRRLRGFSSPTYRMPSSYYNYRYSDAYFLTMAYDPAFYNVVIMGDEVWVEPRYVSNMFGSWGRPYWYGYNRYYGYYGYDYWGYNYYDPYYYSWGYSLYYYGHYPYYGYGWYGPHHHHNHYNDHHHHNNYPHYGGGGGGNHDRDVVHRPSYGSTSGGRSTVGTTTRGSSVRGTYENRINNNRSTTTSTRSSSGRSSSGATVTRSSSGTSRSSRGVSSGSSSSSNRSSSTSTRSSSSSSRSSSSSVRSSSSSSSSTRSSSSSSRSGGGSSRSSGGRR